MRTTTASMLTGVFALLLPMGAAHAAPVTMPGVTVTGSGTHNYLLGACSTCPLEGERRNDSRSDPTSATTTLDESLPFDWLASATLAASGYLPELKALAAAYDPTSPASTDFHLTTTATASAQALQLFTYDGLADEEFTIEYTVDGEISGTNASIGAGIGIFGENYVPRLEGEFQRTRITSHQQSIFAAGAFVRTGSVTFSVQPGDIFYISSFLTANALWTDGDPDSIADASHTMTARFTAGDPTLLRVTTPGVPSTVPEPASLTLLALAAAACLRRGQMK